MDHFRNSRKEYDYKSLRLSDLANEPLQSFKEWFSEANDLGIEDLNVMSLATADQQGKPSCRIVLLKKIADDGFIFFTNFNSKKGQDIEGNSAVAATFYWPEVHRQVRIEGRADKVSVKEAGIYFSERPAGSQISAFISPQSKVIESKEVLEKLYDEAEKKFEGRPIPLPEKWGGYKIIPTSVEFWQGRPNRLHDRIRFYKKENETVWRKEILAP